MDHAILLALLIKYVIQLALDALAIGIVFDLLYPGIYRGYFFELRLLGIVGLLVYRRLTRLAVIHEAREREQ